MRPLAVTYDAALLDLDGTVYLGGVVIDRVPEALAAARERGMATLFVTNNASRPPEVVAESLTGMGITATADDVLTSPQAAADMLAERHPAGAKVLVVGALYLHEAVAGVGLTPVELAAEQPVAVVQGHSPDTGWRQLAEACIALRAGADWVACNTDSTLPTDRGLLPGNGAMVAALVAATGLQPRVAGKPARPLLDSAIARAAAKRPLVVGDRLDTDIEAAAAAGLPALMPLTGVNTAADLLTAPAHRRPTHICFDLRGLVDPGRVVALADSRHPEVDPADVRWTVSDDDGLLTLAAAAEVGEEPDDGAVLGALGALLSVCWQQADADDTQPRVRAADTAAAAALARLGIESADTQRADTAATAGNPASQQPALP